MHFEPGFDAFRDVYDGGRPQVVWTRLVADLDTPVSAMVKLAGNFADSFLLESVEGGSNRGRYSIIGLKPDVIWRCEGNDAEINRDALSARDTFKPCDGGSLESLRSLVEESRIDLPDSLPPMAAGLVGYMGYDMVRLMERLPTDNPDVLGVPDGLFLRPTIMAIFDSVAYDLIVVTPVRPSNETDAKAAYAAAVARLQEVTADFERDVAISREQHVENVAEIEPDSNMSREAFHSIVKTAKDYIRDGDIFQVVLSQRFSVPFSLPPFALYRALRRLNPSPFLFYLDYRDFAVIGSSPEILVRLRDDTVTIRPIAGTRKRGRNRAEDEALIEDLLSDPKERAEHLMLLDLGRNDVGRVSEINSVRVTEQFTTELYSHVMHIVSNVEGTIRDDLDAMDALVAGFPAGTVSGAPKVRAMEIIDELEPDRRGIYAGCVGYFAANGTMDTCIALRTAMVKDQTMYVQAGGGIVADSDPESEFQESCNKARALIRAAEVAVSYAAQAKPDT